MATMKEMKKRLTDVASIGRINISRAGNDKITIDLNGDGEPEAALIDTNGTGSPDLLAVDLTGDHKFNLYLDDTDENKFPDVMYIDKKGDGNIQLLSIGEEVKDKLHKQLVEVFAVLTDDEAPLEELDKALRDLVDAVKKLQARAVSKKD